MTERTIIHREMARRLTVNEEIMIIGAAYSRKASPAVRVRLAALFLVVDRFDDLIALLAPHQDLAFRETLILAEAHLARRTAEDDRAAHAAAARAVAQAGSPVEAASALAMRGKTETRLGEIACARETLNLALAHDPTNKDACKRLAALDLSADDPAAVLAMADKLTERGAAHAPLFAARAIAYARSGDIAGARAISAFHELHHAEQLPPPPGWESIETFNAALAAELLAHPGLRYERYGTASELTWRIDLPATRDAPLVRLLLDQLTAAIHRYLERVAGCDHPWTTARPAEALLRSWCVITESEGFETWHLHPFSWLSGVYYVRVPDSVAQGNSDAGCIAFGIPEDQAGDCAADAFGQELVRPREGLMLAFPSHTYHRTFPHGGREKRICFAFDLRPS